MTAIFPGLCAAREINALNTCGTAACAGLNKEAVCREPTAATAPLKRMAALSAGSPLPMISSELAHHEISGMKRIDVHRYVLIVLRCLVGARCGCTQRRSLQEPLLSKGVALLCLSCGGRYAAHALPTFSSNRAFHKPFMCDVLSEVSLLALILLPGCAHAAPIWPRSGR